MRKPLGTEHVALALVGPALGHLTILYGRRVRRVDVVVGDEISPSIIVCTIVSKASGPAASNSGGSSSWEVSVSIATFSTIRSDTVAAVEAVCWHPCNKVPDRAPAPQVQPQDIDSMLAGLRKSLDTRYIFVTRECSLPNLLFHWNTEH
jgi:hypothetical protein